MDRLSELQDVLHILDPSVHEIGSDVGPGGFPGDFLYYGAESDDESFQFDSSSDEE